ncbi:MAG: hypothetical protein Q7O66_01225 [Dehalococcoidia bacterium]|nr:hypothetical protein [Dehalococcoidia bacterium]
MSKRVIEGSAPYEMSPEMDEQVSAMIDQADQDVEEVRVNIRWRKAQVDVIKRAAARFGLPYQTYIKQAVFRQSLADLQASEAAIPGRKQRQ